MKIPTNLEECFESIDDMKIDDMHIFLEDNERDAVIMCHHTFGQWIRNNWDLWNISRTPFWKNTLVKYFYEMGIYHPDDMSSIILTSYHRMKNGKDIKLEEQIEQYKNYWKKQK